jgi:hypothetical protein
MRHPDQVRRVKGPASTVTPGRERVMLSTSAGAIFPSLAALAAASARAWGDPRHELNRHVGDDVPTLA